MEISFNNIKESFKIGFRKVSTKEGCIEINERKIFLRGKSESMIFPSTGFEPMTIDEWKKNFQSAKQFGINHYIFHNCCPPEAAFSAADELGIYITAEIPFIKKDFGQQDSSEHFSEIYNILNDFGNHPSLLMLSLSQDFFETEDKIQEAIINLKNFDDRHLYICHKNNDTPCGFLSKEKPNSNHVCKISETNSEIKNLAGERIYIKEIGHYSLLPYSENDARYSVLKSCGFENQSENHVADSARFAMQCYKMEIESALRNNSLAGFQFLSLQDFTGKGLSSPGIMNAFMEPKDFVTGEQWRSFCSKTVLLSEFEKFVWQDTEEFSAKIIFHNFSEIDYTGQYMSAFLINTEDNEILYEENFEIKNSLGKNGFRGNIELGTYKYKFEESSDYKKICFLLVLNPDDEDAKSIINSYTLHVYPKPEEKILDALNKFCDYESVEIDGAILTKNKNTKSSNKKVIYFPTSFNQKTSPGIYCYDFSGIKPEEEKISSGVLGLSIKKDSMLLKAFPTDSYETPKWYNIVAHSTFALIPKDCENIIQVIDNFKRNWNLGILFEDDEGKIICTSKLWEIVKEPEVGLFLKSLLTSSDSL